MKESTILKVLVAIGNFIASYKGKPTVPRTKLDELAIEIQAILLMDE